jgi:hypothetical protein
MLNETIIQYIYILQEREFIKTEEPIYKIGKSKQMNLGRFSQYPNGSVLYFQLVVPDCDKIEKILIRNFKGKYLQRTDIGTEYFQGDVLTMMDDIYREVFEYRKRLENPVPLQSKKIIESFPTFDFDKFRYTEDKEEKEHDEFLKKPKLSSHHFHLSLV